MSGSKISAVYTQDVQIQRVQDNILTAINDIKSNPFLGGVVVNNVALVSGNNNVPHGLNRPYQGVLITKRSTGAVIFDFDPADPRQFVGLNSSADCVVNLWVY